MISIEKFAKILNVSRPSVYYWLDQGYLERKECLGRIYFNEIDVKLAKELREAMFLETDKYKIKGKKGPFYEINKQKKRKYAKCDTSS